MKGKALFCFFILVAIQLSISAATNVTDDIKQDTTWALTSSPHYIMNDVEVKENSTLTIEPGVQVHFNGSYRLDIEGALIAEGNSISLIEFISSGGGEVYIEYTSTGGNNNLSYCRFNNTRLEAYESSVDIRDSVFHDSDMEIRSGNFTMYISNNTFTNCGSNAIMRGIFPDKHIYVTQNEFNNCTPELRGREETASYVYFSNNTVQGSAYGAAVMGWTHASYNTFHNNTYGVDINDAYGEVNLSHNLIYNNSIGIYVEDMVDGGVVSYNTITLNNIGIFVNEYLGVYSYNNLHDNFDYGVRAIDIEHSMPSEEIMMIHNWWGTDEKHDIDEYIYDYYDDAGLPEVVYDPYLNTFVCEAPILEPIADADCDGAVSDFELLGYIVLWNQGEVDDFDLLNAIDAWAS
ncbi:MAG: right-handed parallel beta-helix repeat-containing protein [Candidatus Altiarchaeota archaeon]|nr:right-handed parallel beta-helix repeat-containing protein [Candidatus Altiarchaeota archaeon]